MGGDPLNPHTNSETTDSEGFVLQLHASHTAYLCMMTTAGEKLGLKVGEGGGG